MLRETTNRGLCGLVCPSHTSECWGEGDCVKEGWGGEGESERERALGLLLCHNPRIEVDPQRRCLVAKQTTASPTLVFSNW